MAEIKDRIKALLIKYLQEELTPEEDRELEGWMAMSEENRLLFNRLADKDQLQEAIQELHMAGENIRRKIDARLGVRIGTLKDPVPGRLVSMPPVRGRRRSWLYAAASLLVLLAGAAYFGAGHFSKAGSMDTAGHTSAQQNVAPGGNKAILTLADGSTLVLDSARTGTLAKQGGTDILKVDSGQIAYKNNTLSNSNTAKSNALWNTVTTPRGGTYRVVLPDGSKIWLNAASSLQFPTSFANGIRQVTLSGEGYFEIVKNKTEPFKVQVGSMLVQVLGTHFDINAYEDEPTIRTTLLEGSVRVANGLYSAVLIPGQQARLQSNGMLSVIDHPDTDGDIAWVNGVFKFQHDNIESVMHQLARWYDVNVEYQGQKTTHTFSGEINRNNNVSDVLTALETTSDIFFKIQGKKIIVLKK